LLMQAELFMNKPESILDRADPDLQTALIFTSGPYFHRHTSVSQTDLILRL